MNPDNLISLNKCNIHCFKLKQKGIISKGIGWFIVGTCEIYATNSNINFKSTGLMLEI